MKLPLPVNVKTFAPPFPVLSVGDPVVEAKIPGFNDMITTPDPPGAFCEAA